MLPQAITADVLARYQSGDSILSLSKELDLGRYSLTKVIRANGKVRGFSEAAILAASQHPKTTSCRVTNVCPHCGIAFQAYPSQGRRFCSQACGYAARTRDLSARFWEKVNMNGPTSSHVAGIGHCWVWTAHVTRGGYGSFTVGRMPKQAHRWSWQESNGPIPPGLNVCHRCDNPPCVRPSHLFLGTTDENIADKIAKGRQAKGNRYTRMREHQPEGR